MFWFLKSKTKKTSKKPAKKRKAKPAKKITKPSKKAPKPARKKEVQQKPIGIVTGYFRVPKVAVIKLRKDSLKIGEEILIKGHTTNFKQKIISLQVDKKPISVAKKGVEFGLKVKKKVRRRDKVYKPSL